MGANMVADVGSAMRYKLPPSSAVHMPGSAQTDEGDFGGKKGGENGSFLMKHRIR